MINNEIIRKAWKKRRLAPYRRHAFTNYGLRLTKLIGLLVFLVMAHTFAMIHFEGMSFQTALWLSLTTVVTVGYGDVSASTIAGQTSTFVFLYILGISLMAHIAAEFIEYRISVRDRKLTGHWRWKKMNDHILIINTPNDNTVNYLERLIHQIRETPSLQDLPVQILTRKFDEGLPNSISKLDTVHYSGVAENSENLINVNVKSAKYIVLLARDTNDAISDSLTFDVLSRIQEIGTDALIVSEVSDDSNRGRIEASGSHVTVRPIRAYPELLVRAMEAPGTETVLENMFNHDDDHMVRIDVDFDDLPWSTIVCRCVTAGAGTPMAYIKDGEVDVNPLPDAVCNGDGIITLINDTQIVTPQLMRECLSA